MSEEGNGEISKNGPRESLVSNEPIARDSSMIQQTLGHNISDEDRELLENELSAREDVEAAMHDVKSGRTESALFRIDQDADPETRKAWAFAIDNVKDSAKSLSETVKGNMVKEWKDVNTSREDAKNFILHSTDLDPEEKADMLIRIEESLEPAEEHESDAEQLLTPAEQQEQRLKFEAMDDQLKSMEKSLKDVKVDPLSDEERQAYQNERTKLEVFSSRLHNFLHPEDPVKTWATRGGKTAGYALLAAFMAIVLSLHLFHNAARKQ